MDRLYLIRKARKASVNQPATQKYSIPIPTTVPHLPPTKKIKVITIQMLNNIFQDLIQDDYLLLFYKMIPV